MSSDVEAAEWEGRPTEAWRAAWRLPSLLVLDSTTSTNDVAMRLAAGGADAGTTVLTERQTHGRGRRGRRWTDAPGRSLLMSVVLRTHGEPADPSTMPLRIGLVVARAIEAATGTGARLKWPNDVLATDGRKLAGVLCEGATGVADAWLVAGIGINVGQRTADFDPDLRDEAVSIRMLGGETRRDRIAGGILDALRPFRIVPPPLDDTTLREIHQRDALRDRQITVDGDVACTAHGIAPDGSLRIRREGTLQTVRSATIRIVDGTAGHARTTRPRPPFTDPDPRKATR